MNTMNDMTIGYLNYLVKTYEGITQVCASTKQRLLSLPGIDHEASYDSMLKGEKGALGLETVKGRFSRQLEKELQLWDVWNEWLIKVPGIGPSIGGKLIILYYYRFIAICKDCGGLLEKVEHELTCVDCGKKAKKDGVLLHRIEDKDFPTISKWWAYMGRHTVEGIMPKRTKGEMANWSTPGRTLGWMIGDQFNRQAPDNPYKAFMLERKKRHQENHPDWSKLHVHNAAKNETVKLFLSHFWVVSRTLQEKEISDPYSGVIMGHTNIIKPFFWEK